jgi:hypothetical protein
LFQVACLLDSKGFLQAHNVGCGFWLRKKINKAQRVFQGFKDWGSLSAVRLFMSFIFSFAALLWFATLPPFFLLRHTHFILVVTFSYDLGMPSNIWVSWAIMPFCLSHGLFHWNFLLPPVWGVILVEIFLWKKSNLGSKRDRKGCTYFRTWKE